MIALLLMIGCTHKVIRNAGTFQLETEAALARQVEASKALHTAVDRAKEAGDWQACIEYAKPALLIDTFAANQAERALWLAGLVEGDDPGPSPQVPAPESLCGPEPAEAPSEEPADLKAGGNEHE